MLLLSNEGRYEYSKGVLRRDGLKVERVLRVEMSVYVDGRVSYVPIGD